MENITYLEELNNFYSKVMTCDATSGECPESWKDFEIGNVPRGFYYESPNIDILVVGKNPGHLMPNEGNHYIKKSGTELVKEHNLLHLGLLNGTVKLKNFHKNLFEYFSYFLDLPINKIYTKMAHTNLFKCSTINNQAKLSEGDILPCYDRFFLKEVSLYRPKVIVALGREVKDFLNKRKREMEEMIGYEIPVVYVKHPTYNYKKDDKWDILSRIKRRKRDKIIVIRVLKICVITMIMNVIMFPLIQNLLIMLILIL